MNSRKVLFWCILFFFCIVSFLPVDTEASPIVYAKGGSIIDEYLQFNNLTYLTLTVTAENARGVARIRGVLAHPYGAGDFETRIADSELVLSASISTFYDQIHFDVQLSEKLTDERTLLFSLRPIPGSDSTYNNRLKRKGAFLDSYPYSLAWVELQVTSQDGSVLEIQKYASPVVIWQDSGLLYTVDTKSLTKPISSVSIIKVNQDDYYPPWNLAWVSTGDDTNLYTYTDYHKVIEEHDLVVFVVKFTDGSEASYMISDMQDTVELKDVSGIHDLYRLK